MLDVREGETHHLHSKICTAKRSSTLSMMPLKPLLKLYLVSAGMSLIRHPWTYSMVRMRSVLSSGKTRGMYTSFLREGVAASLAMVLLAFSAKEERKRVCRKGQQRETLNDTTKKLTFNEEVCLATHLLGDI